MVGFCRLLACLPLALLRALGALAGRLAYACSGSYRRKLRDNLAQAGYDPGAMGGPAAAEAGRMVGELPWVWFRPLPVMRAHVRCDDLPVLEAAERDGRGIVFLTPHLGAFEVTARWYALRAPITVLYKPPRQRALARLLAVARAVPGMATLPATLAGVRGLVRALRRGEAVGLLPDQVPSAGEGRWVDFFGRRAYTMTLPERLAQMTGAAVILAFGERLPAGGGWRVHLARLQAPATPDAVNAAMERLIRAYPAQYLWGYNRYKGAGDAR